MKKPLNKRDFEILNIVALSNPISSWSVCQKLFPESKNPANHLSSVIWRLEKLAKIGAVKKEPHPTRPNKVVYAMADYYFHIDGTFFFPTQAGSLVLNCRFAGECSVCKWPNCSKLKDALRQEAGLDLEPVLKIAQTLFRTRSNPQ